MRKLGETGDYDVVITEVGGTAGDIESLPYLEAIRQFALEEGRANVCLVHLTLVPYLAAAGELKTKPTQHSVKTLQSYGLQPDALVCRTEHPLDDDIRRKIANFCNVEQRAVVQMMDAESIYEVPLLLREQGIDQVVIERLRLAEEAAAHGEPLRELRWTGGSSSSAASKTRRARCRVALVGKYVEHQDAYKSISESFIIAGAAHGVQVEVVSVHSETITERRTWPRQLGDVSRHPRRAGLRRARDSRARSRRCGLRARTASRSSASASGCSAP